MPGFQENPLKFCFWIPGVCFILLFHILLIQSDSALALQHRSKYNEFCNKTIKCVATAWLTCENEKCSCAKPTSMVYDNIRRKCVIKPDETCKYAFGEENTLLSSSPRYEYLDCVENSNCDINLGVCKCISSHYENTENGTCSPQKFADSPCQYNEECRSDLGLVCYKGKCDCNPETSVVVEDRAIFFHAEEHTHSHRSPIPLHPPHQPPLFHPIPHPHPHPHLHPHIQQRQHSRPLTFPGQFQPIQPPRVPFQMRFDTMSDEDDEEGTSIGKQKNHTWKYCAGLPGNPCINSKCSPNASCYMQLNEKGLYNATCVCNSPAYVSSKKDGTCKANFGNRCKTSSDCNEQFQCLNNHCKCKYGNHQVFDELTSECKSLISGPCNSTSDCVVNAVCDQNTTSGARAYTSCQCKEGYKEFGPGFCRKGYGEDCNPHEALELRIPPSVQARDPSQIQSITRKHYIIEQSTLSFITNLELERQSFVALNGLSSSRIIVEDKCDVASQLQCRGGKCSCEEEMEVYDEKRKMCVGAVGALCRQSSGFSHSNLSCVENAECGNQTEAKEKEAEGQKPNRSEIAKCQCKRGYQANSKRLCVKA